MLIRRHKGQLLVEFVLMLGVFLMFTLGVLDYGMYMYTKYTVEGAVRNGARSAVKMRNWNGNEAANRTTISNSIVQYCQTLPPNFTTGLAGCVQIELSPNAMAMTAVSVRVNSLTYRPLLGFGGYFIPKSISSQAAMRYQ